MPADRLGMPEPPRSISSLPKGTGFTRYAMALARSRGSLPDAANIADRQWDWHKTTPDVGTVLKAAVAAGTTSDASWAGPLVAYQTLAAEFIEALRPATIVGRLAGIRRVPFLARMPRVTSGSTAAWAGQAKPKPISRMSLDLVQLAPTKVAGIIVLSDEIVRFSTPSAVASVQRDMIAGISQFMDAQFIDPAVTAVADTNPASITNGITPRHSTGATVAAVTADVAAVFAVGIAANVSYQTGFWIMHPRTALALSMMRETGTEPDFPDITIKGGTFFGLPVIVSASVPINSSGQAIIVLIDASEIFLSDDGQVLLDVSRETSLQMVSDPATGAAQEVSLWQANMVGLRAERYVNYQRRRDAAVGVIDQITF